MTTIYEQIIQELHDANIKICDFCGNRADHGHNICEKCQLEMDRADD